MVRQTDSILIVSLLFFAHTAVSAQTVAYVSSEEIFKRLPQAVEARGKLGELQAKWMNEIRTLEKRTTVLRTEIENNRLLWSSQERSTKEGELREVEGRLQEIRSTKFGPNGEFERQYRELMAPVVELVMVAVRAEAEAKKYDFVLDRSSRGLPVLFANPDHDLTYAVLTRLGVKLDASELEKRKEEEFRLLPESIPIELETNLPVSSPRSTTTIQPPQEPRENPNKLLDPTEEVPD